MNIINKHLNKSPLIIIFFVYNIVFCQDINYDRIILPNNAENINLKERLVQLAWQNNPINKIQNNNVNIAKRNIKLERYGWLGNIRITANINEFVINPARDEFNRAQFFPLYNIGASIPLNIFLSNPQEIISAKLLHENEKYSLNQLKLETRSKVLRRFEIYSLNKELYKLQSEKTENAFAKFSLVEEEFKNGIASLDEYNQTYENYSNEQINLLTSKKDLELSIIDLEEVIGIDLDIVLQNYSLN